MPIAKSRTVGLTVRVFTRFEDCPVTPAEWDEAVARLGGPIYQTFDWLQTWWELYGRDRQLRLFVFQTADQTVGILPFYLETFGWGPLKTTVVRLVGANIPPKTFNPPVTPEYAPAVLAGAVRHLFRADGCDLLALGPVSDAWPGSHACRRLAEQEDCLRWVSSCRYAPHGVQTWFSLPATFEEYLKSLGSTERKNRLKRMRHLEKGRQVTTDMVADPGLVEQEFDTFVRQHARQWQAVGKGGHFTAWPQGEVYNRAQVKAQARHGRVRFFRMLVDGQVVCRRYTFLLGSTLYSELPAREVGEPWDKLGIGGISLLKFNEQVIHLGITGVDSGLGDYEHKANLGGQRIPAGVWRITGRGLRARRARIFLGLAQGGRFLGHKLWYRRILPRLPRRFERAQSLWWLRFNI